MFPLGKRQAFTLSELLVVVILTGILAAVAVPKFSRVLETRKTEEAEAVFRVVRTEQEERCTFGKNYDPVMPKQARAALDSTNYDYVLLKRGIKAQSKSKDYAIKMLSYKDGRMCCLGEYCQKLNKDYPLCSGLTGVSYDDNCAADVEEDCSDAPVQAKCCSSVQKWDGKECVAKTYCEMHPTDCGCTDYAQANPCECAPTTCACQSYFNQHLGECDPNSCEANPYQSKCCDPQIEKWDGSKCAAKTACERDDQKNTCACGAYAAANPCACEETANTCACPAWAQANKCICTPDDCSCKPNQEKCCNPVTQKWTGSACAAKTPCERDDQKNTCACSDYAAMNFCECDPDGCLCKPNQQQCCQSPAVWDGQFCVIKPADPCDSASTAGTCSCSKYAAQHLCECFPSKENCCGGDKCALWSGGRCVFQACMDGHMDENCKCVSNCTDSYGPGSSASQLTMDTCDGNTSSRYTCNGVAKTCTDVYSALSSHIAMASYAVDPFYNFAEDSIAALSLDSGKQTEAVDFGPISGGSSLGGGNMELSCNLMEGYKMQNGKCVFVGKPDPLCVDGYHLENGKCVKDLVAPPVICASGYHLVNGKCVKDNDPVVGPVLCLAGYHLDKNGICVPDTSVVQPIETYYKRTVTCCAR